MSLTSRLIDLVNKFCALINHFCDVCKTRFAYVVNVLLMSRDGEGQIQIQSRQPGSRLKTPGLPIWVRYQQ